MSRIKSRDTGPERRVRKRLHALGFRFRLYRRDLPGTPDIVLPRYRTVVMVHGCLWHGHRFCACRGSPKSNVKYWKDKIQINRERDRRKVKELRKLGWKVITVWECETKVEQAIDGRIASLLLVRGVIEAAYTAHRLSLALRQTIRGMIGLAASMSDRIRSWIRKFFLNYIQRHSPRSLQHLRS